MTETKMLIGSLSNDLSRVANMMYRKSSSAEIFFHEMFRWINALDTAPIKPYIQTILKDLKSHEHHPQFTDERAETYLMYSVILQNYTLRIK
ncbi:MAG: hypothetical protein Q8L37_02280 [Candidatus Gottesmanbacteria bacterium]|nr:hypothetical protein [Candidatus Gottesmanbacteria bacterium]